MKKITLIIVAALFTTVAFSQQHTASAAKKLTIAEANALNGTAKPMMNGKPYSEYKAAQQKQASANNAPVPMPVIGNLQVTLNAEKPVVTATPPTEVKTVAPAVVPTVSPVSLTIPVQAKNNGGN